MKAPDFLKQAATEMEDRASQRDTPDGERSMGRTVAAFNAMFGTNLTETQGWQFMELLKMSRSANGVYREDDHTDGAAYASLAGEAASVAVDDTVTRENELQTDMLQLRMVDAIDRTETVTEGGIDLNFIRPGDMSLAGIGISGGEK